MDFVNSMTFELNHDKGMKEFNSELDARRAKLYQTKFPVRKKSQEVVCIEEIEGELESGEYLFSENGVAFQCLIQRKCSDSLYVFLNGAAGTVQNPRKSYHRWSWGNLVNATIINILDPMYDQYTTLPIGWYWGTKDCNFRELMGRLILKIAKKVGCKNEKIVIYGSSAGGDGSPLYSALYQRMYCSCY